MMRRNGIKLCAVAWLLVSIAACGSPAEAHAFGVRYELPLALWLYLAGAGAAVGFSFVVMAFFMRAAYGLKPYPSLDLLRIEIGAGSRARYGLYAIQLLSVVLFALILVTGAFGDQRPTRNPAPTLVWVVWWVGMAYVSALFGDLWAVLNPWRVLFSGAEALWRRVQAGATLSRNLAYPVWLGYWPSVALFAIFAWLELVSDSAELPARLAVLIVLYSLITWGGMFFFGGEIWRTRGEVFSVVFGLLARFAPLAAYRDKPGTTARVALRPPAVGLLTDRAVPGSMMVFVLLLLSSVTFDGFRETPAWVAVKDWIVVEPGLRPLLLDLRERGVDLLAFVDTSGIIAFLLLFLAAYMAFCRLVAWIGGGVPLAMVARSFVLTLVPIAIAYHLAHYLFYLLVAGQLIIPVASDPFGAGWNLFGTVNYRIDVGIVNARFVWYLSVGAIVVGHVLAVYLAHAMALRVFATQRRALMSQIAMMVLMVGYTMISLWILSQPVVVDATAG